MAIVRFGDQALLATVPAGTAADRAAALRLDPFWLSVVPTNSSILVTYLPGRYRYARQRLGKLLESTAPAPLPRTIVIPVRYGGEVGPDLLDVAAAWGVSVEEAIRLHRDRLHRVLFLGFLPGFPYLESNLPPVVRLDTPRLRVPAGSVAVSGSRTGIYPRESPGGWRIIGRTPVTLFDVTHDPPALLSPGDVVRFQPISPGQSV